MTEVIRCDGCRKIVELDGEAVVWMVNTVVYFDARGTDASSREALDITLHACSRKCLNTVAKQVAEEVAGAKV